jgi:formylglycine-generating enzyme required for sulfatase activity
VVRGGSWIGIPEFLRSALRNWGDADTRDGSLGFRLAQDP